MLFAYSHSFSRWNGATTILSLSIPVLLLFRLALLTLLFKWISLMSSQLARKCGQPLISPLNLDFHEVEYAAQRDHYTPPKILRW